jgi:hypothetical protein
MAIAHCSRGKRFPESRFDGRRMRKAKPSRRRRLWGWLILASMLTYLRYALATFCFAASVGCLALWWHWDKLLVVDYFGIKHQIGAAAEYGISSFYVFEEGIPRQTTKWRVAAIKGWELPWFYNAITREGLFGRDDNGVYFPLRYAALVSALAGVAALRLGRRFTLRSAIIATTVLAGLLGMAVGL